MPADTSRVHELSKSYHWAPVGAPPAAVFPTRYQVPQRGRDPFKLLWRDYARMEVEKDLRVHKALDAAAALVTGSPIGVTGADDDAFRELESNRDRVVAAQLFVRYRNIVITLHYTHYALGANHFIQPLQTLSALAVQKL